MSRQFHDYTGERRGRLVVDRRAPNVDGRVAWVCRCDCGNTRTILAVSLRAGTSSCGCGRRTAAQEFQRRQNLARAGQKRYRPVEDVIGEIFRNPLDRLAVYAKQALEHADDEVTA